MSSLSGETVNTAAGTAALFEGSAAVEAGSLSLETDKLLRFVPAPPPFPIPPAAILPPSMVFRRTAPPEAAEATLTLRSILSRTSRDLTQSVRTISNDRNPRISTISSLGPTSRYAEKLTNSRNLLAGGISFVHLS